MKYLLITNQNILCGPFFAHTWFRILCKYYKTNNNIHYNHFLFFQETSATVAQTMNWHTVVDWKNLWYNSINNFKGQMKLKPKPFKKILWFGLTESNTIDASHNWLFFTQFIDSIKKLKINLFQKNFYLVWYYNGKKDIIYIKFVLNIPIHSSFQLSLYIFNKMQASENVIVPILKLLRPKMWLAKKSCWTPLVLVTKFAIKMMF